MSSRRGNGCVPARDFGLQQVEPGEITINQPECSEFGQVGMIEQVAQSQRVAVGMAERQIPSAAANQLTSGTGGGRIQARPGTWCDQPVE
jgi:hypothetical protein